MIFAFLTHKELGNQFTEAAAIAKAKQVETNQADATVVEVVVKEEIAEPVVEEKVEEEFKEETPKEETVVPAAKKEEVAAEKAKTNSYKGTYPTKEMMANFPSFRGPGGNAIAYQKNIPNEWDGASGKNILWKQPVPIHAYNSPVIWGNKLFLSRSKCNKS